MFSGGKHLPALALVSTLLLTACDNSSDNGLSIAPTYFADIVWTQYGIPHITAKDYGSAGYGVGYAYARENFCTIMREYVFAAGESARYLGDEGDLNSDFVMHLYNSDERIERMIKDDLPDDIVQELAGYSAGTNRFLKETGVDHLAEGCRGAARVRDIELEDVVRLLHKAVLVRVLARDALTRGVKALRDAGIELDKPSVRCSLSRRTASAQAITGDETDCPIAYADLTYSQSTDPASQHYADATRLYSSGGWIDIPFCRADRDAQAIGHVTISQ